eukprot:3573655-Alexandrium_andersonii.AAC.1
MGPLSSSSERLKRYQCFQYSVRPAACRIASIDSIRYSVLSVLGLRAIEHFPGITPALGSAGFCLRVTRASG